MYLTLHTSSRSELSSAFIDKTLPYFVRELGCEFSRFADCGAGVGSSAINYASILKEHLPKKCNNAQVYCYEPLPENFAMLERRLGNNPIFSLKKVAVSDFTGQSNFHVPSRMKGGDTWVAGTSYGGSLEEKAFGDNVVVPTVRLDQETNGSFDFIKVDLQGGELRALKGLGEKIKDVKLIYSETQLLKDSSEVVDFLQNNGFIVFYDLLQFGFKDPQAYVDVDSLKELGLCVSTLRVPTSDGFPLILWGHFDRAKGPKLNRSGQLEDDVKKFFVKAGLNYLQTDIIAVNVNNFNLFAQLVSDQL